MNRKDSVIFPRLASLPDWEILPKDTLNKVRVWNARREKLHNRAVDMEAQRVAAVAHTVPERDRVAAWEKLEKQIAELYEEILAEYEIREEIIFLIRDTIDEDLQRFENAVATLRASTAGKLHKAGLDASEQLIRAASEEYNTRRETLERITLGVNLTLPKLPSKSDRRIYCEVNHWLAQQAAEIYRKQTQGE